MTSIFGHRGCRGANNPPENSLAAFAEAIRQGADGIEFDLFLTTDKTLIVFHDDTLEKRTNGKGKTARKTLAELKKLRLKENDGRRLSNETIPTLDEVMALVKGHADENFILNIEIKQKKIAREVAAALKAYLKQGWKAERFLVAAFDMPSLRIVKKELPMIPIAALFAGRGPSWNISKLALAKKLKQNAGLKPETINITLPSMTPRAIALIKKTGAKPVAWTANEVPPSRLSAKNRTLLSKFLAQNFTLITDYPTQVRAMLNK
jgi:glycerophosphoryl diester phosphodiesterase